MILIEGVNLYTDSEMAKYDFVGFTANSTITQDGKLVMGAGTAKIVRDTFKGIDDRFGSNIDNLSDFYIKLDYQTRVFALQTKRHWKDESPIDLVKESISKLKDIAAFKATFAIPYPAIGYGGLSESDIQPLIEQLPDNVFVYKI